MSKRTQSIRSMFTAGPEEDLATSDLRMPVQRVASGAVRSLKDTFSEVERDYEALKERVAQGALPVDLDTAVIDPSPFADRFLDQDAAALEALVTSMREHGQEMPILVRPHPSSPGRYQIAYGHRRLKAASSLGLPIKAYVRELSDDRLVVAQGIENSAREDLSFIERAMFALKLEVAGFQRTLIQSALSVDRAEVSKLISVAQAVPDWIITAIGRAPRIGRGRWQDLAELLKAPGAENRARTAIESHGFAQAESDDRFVALVDGVKAREKPAKVLSEMPAIARAEGGAEIARMALSARHCKIQINRERDEAFALFLMEELPTLYARFRKDNGNDE